MLASVKDLHPFVVEDVRYAFRTPTLYDPARIQRSLTLQRVRRPIPLEFKVAAIAGLAALGKATGDPAEAERQQSIVERHFELMKPTDEDDIDEPDFKARAVELGEREAARLGEIAALRADVMAIEATLERHWPPYAELVADRDYWDAISRIEIVRLLLQEVGGVPVRKDADGLMSAEAYAAIPTAHRLPLATFAFRLLAPGETQRKN